MEIEEVVQKCNTSKGYILFAGYITDKKDENGFPVIDWQYHRDRFSFADCREAQHVLGNEIEKDMETQTEESS